MIGAADIEQAQFLFPCDQQDIKALDISQGIDIQEIIADLARHYLRKALAATNLNKSQAASLLGLKSQQTLSNWMSKYGID